MTPWNKTNLIWYVILFLYYWIQFDNILFYLSVSVLMCGLVCTFSFLQCACQVLVLRLFWLYKMSWEMSFILCILYMRFFFFFNKLCFSLAIFLTPLSFHQTSLQLSLIYYYIYLFLISVQIFFSCGMPTFFFLYFQVLCWESTYSHTNFFCIY